MCAGSKIGHKGEKKFGKPGAETGMVKGAVYIIYIEIKLFPAQK